MVQKESLCFYYHYYDVYERSVRGKERWRGRCCVCSEIAQEASFVADRHRKATPEEATSLCLCSWGEQYTEGAGMQWARDSETHRAPQEDGWP